MKSFLYICVLCTIFLTGCDDDSKAPTAVGSLQQQFRLSFLDSLTQNKTNTTLNKPDTLLDSLVQNQPAEVRQDHDRKYRDSSMLMYPGWYTNIPVYIQTATSRYCIDSLNKTSYDDRGFRSVQNIRGMITGQVSFDGKYLEFIHAIKGTDVLALVPLDALTGIPCNSYAWLSSMEAQLWYATENSIEEVTTEQKVEVFIELTLGRPYNKHETDHVSLVKNQIMQGSSFNNAGTLIHHYTREVLGPHFYSNACEKRWKTLALATEYIVGY